MSDSAYSQPDGLDRLPDVKQTQVKLREWLRTLWYMSNSLAALSYQPGGDQIGLEEAQRLIARVYQEVNKAVPFQRCRCARGEHCDLCNQKRWLSTREFFQVLSQASMHSSAASSPRNRL